MSSESVKKRVEEAITKSAGDKRAYRHLTLGNDLQVLLVSDPTTDKSAASLDVQIGSMSDPWDIPGLAHFCEHMLFMGTSKYADENDYTKYLSEHSGRSNAYTAGDHTNYFFDVSPDALTGALDRFSHFFKTPLFTESCVEREVCAVQDEHDKNVCNDGWRLMQVEKNTCDKTHSYSKFGTGNKDTLMIELEKRGVKARDVLIDFHKQWYSSNVMGLAVLGKESLDELESMVVPMFSCIENSEVEAPVWLDHPFVGPAVISHVATVKDLRNLSLSWPLPDLIKEYESAPCSYVSHLIGHEGPGSLLSYLKKEGLANDVCAGEKSGARGFSFFNVDIDLTETGLKEYKKVIHTVFQYINMIKNTGPLEWVFDEMSNLDTVSFKFQEKQNPQNYVESLASNIRNYCPEDLLCHKYKTTKFSPDLITNVVDKLTVESVRIIVAEQHCEKLCDHTDKYYGTKFSCAPIEDEVLGVWKSASSNDELFMPKPNVFIPVDFSLCTNETTNHPEIISEDSLSKLWYKLDDKYNLPKCIFASELYSPIAYSSPHSANMLSMFSDILKDNLREYAYDAVLAGIIYQIRNTNSGLSIVVSGYHDKQILLVNAIMEKLMNFTIDKDRFEMLKETYLRGLNNFKADQPYVHSNYYTSFVMSQHAWSKEELLLCQEFITPNELEKFVKDFLSELFVESLVHGSVSSNQARNLELGILTPLRDSGVKAVLPSRRVREREVKLPVGSSHYFDTKNTVHANSSITVVYQGGASSTEQNALYDLTAQILSEPTFDELRTKQQLGYIVQSGVRASNGTRGFNVMIQSPYPVAELEERIETFLQKMEVYIADMSEKEFETHREALIQSKLEQPKMMGSLSIRWWGEIMSNQYNFGRHLVAVEYLRSITKEQLLDHYKKFISPSSATRAKLSIRVTGTEPKPAENPPAATALAVTESTEIVDANAFKQRMELFPLAQPFVPIGKAKL